MLRRNTPRQIQDWLIYEQLEPFGELRDDYRAALVASEVANLGTQYRRTPKDGKMFTVEERLLKWGILKKEQVVRQPVEEQIRILKIIAMAQAAAKD